eukprot:TRINITY_DN4423_c0_g1_i2.p1 TRINITY_DN4423_c0_g1~~TRINITY_DN4423_c0_g1_i2.p1  ORF type:complete len:338 (-),score=41.34 TRINITY_DN4423_c0_g1_i2:79-1092(-)
MILKPSILYLLCFFFSLHYCVPPYTQLWFDQTVDHFNLETQPQTFKQRYLVYDKVWNRTDDGPIFFYTGNEGDITNFWANTGFVFDIAPAFGAVVVFAEHRFYGESYPYGKVHSFDREHIGLLSVEQALADYATLIRTLKKQWNAQNSAVFAFGGSYGGQLSFWMRLKYPFVIDAALASSAPVKLVYDKKAQPDYFETVTDDFARANPICPSLVRQGFSAFLDLVSTGQPGFKTLTNTFQTCSPINSADAANLLLLWIVNSFGSMAMVDYPYPANFLAPLPAWPIKAACEMIIQAPTPLIGIARAAGLFYNGTSGNLTCFDIAEEFVPCSDQTGLGA